LNAISTASLAGIFASVQRVTGDFSILCHDTEMAERIAAALTVSCPDTKFTCMWEDDNNRYNYRRSGDLGFFSGFWNGMSPYSWTNQSSYESSWGSSSSDWSRIGQDMYSAYDSYRDK
jgi:hypothetical protein